MYIPLHLAGNSEAVKNKSTKKNRAFRCSVFFVLRGLRNDETDRVYFTFGEISVSKPSFSVSYISVVKLLVAHGQIDNALN